MASSCKAARSWARHVAAPTSGLSSMHMQAGTCIARIRTILLVFLLLPIALTLVFLPMPTAVTLARLRPGYISLLARHIMLCVALRMCTPPCSTFLCSVPGAHEQMASYTM